MVQAGNGQEARPWAKERVPRPGRRQNRLGITTSGACKHSPWPRPWADLIKVREKRLEGDLLGDGELGEEAWALRPRLEQRPHAVVGRAWTSLETWEAPYTKPHGNKRQADWAWAGGGAGALELQPALCWPSREVHSTQTSSTWRAEGGLGLSLSTPKGIQTGRWGPMRLGLRTPSSCTASSLDGKGHSPCTQAPQMRHAGLEVTWSIHPPLEEVGVRQTDFWDP